MLTTNGSLATADTVTSVGTERTVPRDTHGEIDDLCKGSVASILTPTMDQLDDFFELLPLLKIADICVFTEAGICRLSHMADPFEATNDLIDRGVKGVVILRPHSIVVAVDGKVEEVCAPAGVQPCEHVREYVCEMKACSISIQPHRSSALAAFHKISGETGRKVQLANRSLAHILICGFTRMLSRCKQWATPTVMKSAQCFATGERTETSSHELSLNAMSIPTD